MDPPARNGCRSVLVVEDEPDIRASLKDALEWEGYHVVAASNGREGLAALPAMPRPCVILLDLMMPVMDGWEFAHVLKGDMELSAIPIVVVTAFTNEIDRNRFAPQAVIPKPVDLGRLLGTLERYCGSA
jgi:CheY-like chemotaxis protein